MAAISNIYKGQSKVRARKSDKIKLKDSHKRFNRECGEVVITRKVQMAPVEIPATESEPVKVIPLTPKQKVDRASFLKFFSRHLKVARANEHPTLSKGTVINGKFVALRSNKW